MKGATSYEKDDTKHYYNFNPRTHEGCDLGQFVFDAAGILISIHAPMKGATRRDAVWNFALNTFQSTHP